MRTGHNGVGIALVTEKCNSIKKKLASLGQWVHPISAIALIH